MRKIGISSGDPAGIGPEITAKALRFLDLPDNFIIIVYGRLITFVDGNKIDKIDNVNQAVSPGIIYWIEIDDPKVIAGKPSSTSGEIAYRILERCAVDLNLQNLDAIVTCPVSKEKIHHTHPEFIGHT
ncbi:MAG: 4-hydroxythreonine-4-phosphate dehydrogenase PdxA, partial [Candidatus Cloacimonadota bacterium]